MDTHRTNTADLNDDYVWEKIDSARNDLSEILSISQSSQEQHDLVSSLAYQSNLDATYWNKPLDVVLTED